MRRLLSRIFGRPTTSTRRSQPKKSRLHVESLESRWCPSVTVGTADAGHTLVITGDNLANHVVIEQNDGLNSLKVVADGVTSFFSSSQITKIKVDLKNGDDYFWYGLAANSNYFYGKEADIKLGKGNDEAWLEFRGGSNTWLLSSLDIDLNAGKGHDELIAHFARKHGGFLNLLAKMGDGNDDAFTNMWGDISGGADVLFDVRGEKGHDELSTWNTFDQKAYSYGSIDITHDATFTVKMEGGDGSDSISALYSGNPDGALVLRLKGGKGADYVGAEVYLQANTDGSLDAIVEGNQGADAMVFQLFDYSGGDANIINALLKGGPGADSFTATPNVTVVS